MRRLGLDEPPLSDRFARIDGLVSAQTHALKRIPELQRGGMFSPRVAESKVTECNQKITALRDQLEELRNCEMDSEQERRLLFLRALATEGAFNYQMYKDGHLNETSYRELAHRLSDRMETMRYDGRFSEKDSNTHRVRRAIDILTRPLEATPIGPALTASRTARAYQVQWGRQQATGHVLDVFDDLIATETSRTQLLQEVRECYQKWHKSSTGLIDSTAAQFPEFVTAMQERLADRLVLNAARQTIGKAAQAGSIPHGVVAPYATSNGKGSSDAIQCANCRTGRQSPRVTAASPLLPRRRRARGKPYSAPATRTHSASGRHAYRAGSSGVFALLTRPWRGRVSCQNPDGTERDLGTLLAGDFFGEIAILQRERRTATCRAVTPCSVFRLRKVDLDSISDACPHLVETLMQVSKDRLPRSTAPPERVDQDT